MHPHDLVMLNADPAGGTPPAPATTPAPAADPAPAPAAAPARTVDHDRYVRVVAAKQGLETQVADQRAQIDALTEKAATVDTLAASVESWKTQATEANTRFERFKAISAGLGTTDTEAVEAAEYAHGKLPEADRPEIGDWLTAIKAKPETAPKILSSWLTAPDAPAAPGATPKPAPRNPANGAQQPGAPAAVSGAQFKAARAKGVRSGDWSDFKALKAAAGYRVSDKPA